MSDQKQKARLDMQQIVFGLYSAGSLCFLFGTLLGWAQYVGK